MTGLDSRLKQCADFVSGKGIAADVGTDHAYLAVHLIKSGICRSVVACDLRKGPLDSAKAHILSEGLEDKIKTVLSDGLDGISPCGVSDVIIAGMGGELITEIISRTEWLKENKVNLILQPMTKAPKLRKYLFESGFEIKCEKAVKSDPFIYSVINSVYSGECKKYTDFDLYTGGLDFNDELNREYLRLNAERLLKEGNGMLKSKFKNSEAEIQANKKISAADEIMNKLGKGREI